MAIVLFWIISSLVVIIAVFHLFTATPDMSLYRLLERAFKDDQGEMNSPGRPDLR